MASNPVVHSHRHDSGNDAIAALSIDRPSHTIALEQQILAKNQALAELNRAWFTTHSILALNLMSSPGSGKTTLLERTIRDIGGELSIQVIEGDQATLRDAERIRAPARESFRSTPAPVVISRPTCCSGASSSCSRRADRW